jgi:hypothetical protein
VTFVKEGMSFSKPSGSSGGAGGGGYSVIRSQARKMAFSVYNFFKNMSEERNKLYFTKCQDISAEACGVSKSVSRICREAIILKDQRRAVFVSPRKSIDILKRAKNLDDFEKDVRRTVFEFYDRRISNSEGKKALSL